MKSNKPGFTLIELLVVIAIIAILAAILFPVFVRAKEGAKQAACLSNVNELSKAWLMYASDWNDGCPALVWRSYVTGLSEEVTWEQSLFRYVKNVKVYYCPSSKNLVEMRSSDGYNYRGTLSYGWNAGLFNYPWLFPVKLSSLEYASKTAFLADSDHYNWCSLPGGYFWAYSKPIGRHNGMANVAFCDGHAKAVKYEALIAKVPNTSGRRVAYISGTSQMGDAQSAWTTNRGITIFPYWGVAASLPHF